MTMRALCVQSPYHLLHLDYILIIIKSSLDQYSITVLKNYLHRYNTHSFTLNFE